MAKTKGCAQVRISMVSSYRFVKVLTLANALASQPRQMCGFHVAAGSLVRVTFEWATGEAFAQCFALEVE